MAIRFGGLGTGQDTQSIIDALLEIERVPVVRLEQKIVQEEEKYAAWDEVETSFVTLSTAANKLNSFLSWRQMIADSSDDTTVTASADYKAAVGDYSANVTTMAKAHRIGSDSQASASSGLSISGTFNINGEDIIVDAADSLADIRDTINSAAANMTDKVKASIVGTTLVVERANTGDTDLTIAEVSGTAAAELGFIFPVGTLLPDVVGDIKNELQQSDDLAATINGVPVVSSKNSGVTDLVEGMTFTFRDTGSSTLSVKRDTETLVENFESFIEAYNEAIEIAEYHSEVNLSSRGEAITGIGALQSDSALVNLRFRSRSTITQRYKQTDTAVAIHSLQDIGIWTDARTNKLSMTSKTKLTAALENNFDEVETMLRDFDEGVMRGFVNMLDDYTSPVEGVFDRRQGSIDTSVRRFDQRIQDIEDRIVDKETQLWEHYSRMEVAVSGMNQQGSMLLGALGVG